MGAPGQQDPSGSAGGWEEFVADLFARTLPELRSLDPSQRSEVLTSKVSSDREDAESGVIHLAYYLEVKRALGGPDQVARMLGGLAEGRLLRDLATVVSRLRDYYDPDAIPDWLEGEAANTRGVRAATTCRGEARQVLRARGSAAEWEAKRLGRSTGGGPPRSPRK